jgi:diguanylate cyclase (GGDEF)-like protein/PAS domain S-box-containing protein
MSSAPVPADEADRLAALTGLNVLDSPPEPHFDAVVQAASLACGTPIALISLVDRHRQWFKANQGLLGVTETSREAAFCAHTILGDDLFEVADATLDPRFADNPLVVGSPRIRFYAGAPIRISGGQKVGTLCVIDQRPRELDDDQRRILANLATVAARALEARLAEQRSEARDVDAQLLQDERRRLAGILEGTGAGTWEWNVQTGETRYNERWAEIVGTTLAELGPTTIDTWASRVPAEDRAVSSTLLERHFAGESASYEHEARMRHRDGHLVWVLDRGQVLTRTPDGRPEWMFGTHLDITARKAQEAALRSSEELLARTGELAQVGGWELDVATGRLVWSAQTRRIHGVASDYEPTLEEAVAFYAPEARPVIQRAVEQAIAGGGGWDLELPVEPRGGGRIWVRAVGTAELVAGRVVRLLGTLQDITARVEQRQALERAHERMSLATDGGSIGIWDLDLALGWLAWDPRMYRLYGLTDRREVDLWERWLSCVHREDRAHVERTIERVTVALRDDLDIEYRVVWPDGSVHHLRSAARVTRSADGAPMRVVGATWDVSEVRGLEAELRQQHELLRVTLQSIADAVITTDAAGHVSWLNPAAERLTGWASAEAHGRPLAQVFQLVNEVSGELRGEPSLPNPGRAPAGRKSVLIARSGAEYGVEDAASPIRNDRGEVLGEVVVFRDVTEQRRLSGEMRYRATHDALTGLVNRMEFESRLHRTFQRAQGEGTEHALLYVDLDQFKLVNDSCGHAVGDQLLVAVAGLLTDCVRSRDTLARLGGDEFAIILEHCQLDPAGRVAQKICDRMDDFRFAYDGRRFRIGASIGLVPIDRRWTDAAAILQAADASCYAAKEAGRNRVYTWFETDEAVRERKGEMQWATRLEQALDDDRFVLFAQRIEPLRDPAPGVHAEVLLRMVDTDGTLKAPGAFLPAAERFHLSSRIDRWVLRHAIAELEGLGELAAVNTLCVNVSGQSVGDRAFHAHAMELLVKAGAAVCSRLCLEITETAAVTNMADAARFIREVRTLGVRVALDDFGAGASSFGYLKTLTVDVLKIDGQFIRGLVTDPLDDATVRCFVDVARVLGLRTVAEFVDHPDVLRRLGEIGVDYAQGFLLHRPEPIGAVLAELAAGRLVG